jgi:hypothetical protein
MMFPWSGSRQVVAAVDRPILQVPIVGNEVLISTQLAMVKLLKYGAFMTKAPSFEPSDKWRCWVTGNPYVWLQNKFFSIVHTTQIRHQEIRHQSAH